MVNQENLYSEGFEYSFGEFAGTGESTLKLDQDVTYKNGKSLNIKSTSEESTLSAGITVDPWSLADYPKVSFSYKIPEGDPVGLRVETQFGDWICLGGTSQYKCGDARPAKPIQLINDGQWHEVVIDVKPIVQSVLPSMERLAQFEFHTDANAKSNDEFWVDDFKIGK